MNYCSFYLIWGRKMFIFLLIIAGIVIVADFVFTIKYDKPVPFPKCKDGKLYDKLDYSICNVCGHTIPVMHDKPM